MALDCACCDYPDPADTRRVPAVTPDGAFDVCRSCAAQLLANPHVQVTLMLEPVAVMS